MDLNLIRSAIPVITLALLPTAGVCGEWVAKDGGAILEQDGAHMVIVCDMEHGRALHPDSLGKIVIFVTEPRANWTKFAKIEVKTTADDGPPAISQPSEGTALTPTGLVIEGDATWELNEMGRAKKSFTIRAGAFSRTYSALRLREAVGPILEKCGDHNKISGPNSKAVKDVVLLVTWLVSGQPPNTYQVIFNSAEACNAARDAVLAEGRRVKAEYDQIQINAAQATGNDPAIFLSGNRSPNVTAICAAQ